MNSFISNHLFNIICRTIIAICVFSSFANTTFLNGIEGDNPCVKSVNELLYPKCEISIREDIYWANNTGQAICLSDNVLLIKAKEATSPNDYNNEEYEDGALDQNYAQITCTAFFPMDFKFEGNGALSHFRIGKFRNLTAESYRIRTHISLLPQTTGKFIIHNLKNPEIQTSFFIFTEAGSMPYMVGGSRVIPAQKLNTTSTLLPCVASDLIANVTLFRKIGQTNWTKLADNESSHYNRQTGFVLDDAQAIPGEYRCFSDDNENFTSTDFTTILVKSPEEQRVEEETKPKNIARIEITKSHAVCYSLDNQNITKFWNFHTYNPTETHYVKECLERQSSYCGVGGRRSALDSRRLNSLKCPNNSSSCLWMSAYHDLGLFYCEKEDGSHIFIEYFQGLDFKIYTNASQAPISALMYVWSDPAVSSSLYMTGILYTFKCAGPLFVFESSHEVFALKYKNGTSLIVSEDLGYWRSYLTTDMKEVSCIDYLWTTGEQINKTIQLNVIEKTCSSWEFKCKMGKCISLSFRCDDDKDCDDASDEENCLSHNDCKVGWFKCGDGKCIRSSNKCDNVKDCTDGSDESTASCANVTCNSRNFQCATGQCVRLTGLCDGIKNCLDGSDESTEQCRQYHPQLSKTKTHVSFAPNSLNELVCKVNYLPERFKPTIAWWRRGANISDQERLWRDNTGLKLALRFENVTQVDAGEYVCIVSNKFETVVQVFVVEVGFQNNTRRGGSRNLDFSENSVLPGDNILPVQEHLVSTSASESRIGAGAIVGITLGTVALIGLVVGGLFFAYLKIRNVPIPPGSARMTEDRVVVLNHL